MEHFSYRVEFQARGLPHIHGVCWIAKEYLADKGITGDLIENEDAAIEIAKEMISWSKPMTIRVKKPIAYKKL